MRGGWEADVDVDVDVAMGTFFLVMGVFVCLFVPRGWLGGAFEWEEEWERASKCDREEREMNKHGGRRHERGNAKVVRGHVIWDER